MNATAGFQCIAALSVHQAAITTIAIASGPNRLAVGDESGMVSPDLRCDLRYHTTFHSKFDVKRHLVLRGCSILIFTRGLISLLLGGQVIMYLLQL